MYIESLDLKNFRNYEKLFLQFDRGTNVLYGDNAQGKTNILEAIHVLGTTKSHRGSRDFEMIRFGEEEAHLRLIFHKKESAHRIDVHLKKREKKGAAVDGIPVRKASDLFGLLNIVFFSPEDLNIIKNGPAERRRFIDRELCQLNRMYMSSLSAYNHVLIQRNALLKELPYEHQLVSTLDVWDEQMVRYGIPVIRLRQKFVEELSKIVQKNHLSLTGGKEEIRLIYEPDVQTDLFEKNLRQSREKDLKMKTSTVGPHRDDFNVQVNQIDIRRFGSQGQQRSAALSLKLSEIDLLREKTGESPVLLLDDVLSELDRNRQKWLLQYLGDIQTFITCTGMDDLIIHHFAVNRSFHIVNGTAEQL